MFSQGMGEESYEALFVLVCQENVLADVQGHSWFKFYFHASFVF